MCQNPEPCAACCKVPCGSCKLRNLSLSCKMLQEIQPCADLGPPQSSPACQVHDWQMEAHGVQHPSGFLLADSPRGKSCCTERCVCQRHGGRFGAPRLSTVPSCPLVQEKSKLLCTAMTPHPIPSALQGLLPVPVSSSRPPPPSLPWPACGQNNTVQ